MTTPPFDFSFPRYLAAKKSVDDRALNRLVWDQLAQAVAVQESIAPLTVLELGAGIGTMCERVIERGLLTQGHYTALDSEESNVQAAHTRLSGSMGDSGLSLDVVQADIFEFAMRPEQQRLYDLLIAHAVLDLFDIPRALTRLLAVLKPGGLCYFTINFDGATIFEPMLDQALDAQIETLYHRSMDERITDSHPSGDSRSGRHLLHLLPTAGVEILAAGSSDWVVYARNGRYAEDEAYFLLCILHFVESTLTGHPELDATAFAAWIAERRRQIVTGDLVYIAHQIDFVGRFHKNDD